MSLDEFFNQWWDKVFALFIAFIVGFFLGRFVEALVLGNIFK